MGREDDKYLWFDTVNGLRDVAASQGIPLIGSFELTARCNLRCNMCYIRHDGNDKKVLIAEKTAEEWISIGEQAAKAGTLFLLITGGEPLIRPDFREIYTALNKLGFIITLYTNATLINENFISWIAKIPPNKIGVTIYGASPEVYAAVTGSGSAFQKALNGIDLLMQAGIKVELRTTITRTNIGDIEAMDAIAQKRKLDISHVLSLVKSVRGAASDVENQRLSAAEMKNVSIKEISCDDDSEVVYKGPPKKVRANDQPMYCSAGKSSYWISWDGELLPCLLMNEPFFDPFNSSFIDAWEKLKFSIPGITAPKECSYCEFKPYCSVCPAKLQAETGSFEKISPYICELAKMIKEKYES